MKLETGSWHFYLWLWSYKMFFNTPPTETKLLDYWGRVAICPIFTIIAIAFLGMMSVILGAVFAIWFGLSKLNALANKDVQIIR
jgi:hypothetical protein